MCKTNCNFANFKNCVNLIYTLCAMLEMMIWTTFTIATILAKILWDKLAECTASTIDQFFTWKPTFFGPNPTFPPSPHAMLLVGKGCRRFVQHCIGGKGEASEYWSNSGKRNFVPHILARIVAWWEWAEFKYQKKQNVENKQLFRKLWICCKSDLHSVRNVGNDELNNVCHS